VFIYDDIGDSYWNENAVTAIQFLNDLKALPSTVSKIVVRVNSLGGSCFDAAAIANALRDQAAKGRTIETSIDGIAASAASVVIMAGSVIRMADNAMVMVHNPWTSPSATPPRCGRWPTRSTPSATRSSRPTSGTRRLSDDDAIVALMDAETWMDADQAIANGFATEKIDGLKAAASIDRAPRREAEGARQVQGARRRAAEAGRPDAGRTGRGGRSGGRARQGAGRGSRPGVRQLARRRGPAARAGDGAHRDREDREDRRRRARDRHPRAVRDGEAGRPGRDVHHRRAERRRRALR
jgi:ATP-dependent protease ClpP protease subunit